ncbi:quinone oxidoreductase [Exophiala viscosa]|uniref:quinone oxidoreductase n=1 Tax=Exophiala viscosa TaxID=2486360 RepID=UPI00218DD76D|nr:quinone oxidoreductase [Exophiala viscosa]
MRAIAVQSWDTSPEFTSNYPDPTTSDPEKVTLKVLAAGLHQLVRSQAAGQHYSTKGAQLPYIPGADGVGTTPEGETVYFSSIASGGAFAEYVTVPKSAIVPIPTGADPVHIAGLLNPGMSSWMALATRVDPLPQNWTVVIVGVAALSGKVAAQFVRGLGAGKVIGVARNAKEMAALNLDQTVVLADNPAETDFSSLGDVDVILDYLYGPAIVGLVNALNSKVPTQYVQIGTVAGPDIALPGAVLRSKNITVRGAGPGSWTLQRFGKELPALLAAVARLPDMALKVQKLEEVHEAWVAKKERTVFVP